jgi:hypothetical protein
MPLPDAIGETRRTSQAAIATAAAANPMTNRSPDQAGCRPDHKRQHGKREQTALALRGLRGWCVAIIHGRG